MSNIERIKWLDGLKGLFCIGIFYHHFLLRYVPESYYGQSIGQCSKLCLYLSESPLGVLINGNFYVFIFILISGYVVCRRTINVKPDEIGVFVVKRYLKLAIPLLLCEIFYYVFYESGVEGLFTETDNIKSFLIVPENALIKVLCYGDTTFAGAFWMMNVIFVGGLLVIVIATIGWKNKKYAMYVFGCVSLAMLSQKSYYFSVLFAGACLNCFFDLVQVNNSSIINVVGVLLGLLLGGYPTGKLPGDLTWRFFGWEGGGIYELLILPFTNDSAYIWHWLASLILFISIYNGKWIKKILETKTLQWLGSLSYIFYVFHNLMRKLFNPLYYLVLNHFGSRTIAVFVDSSIVLISLLIVCEIYRHIISIIENRIVNAVLKPLS